MEVKNYTGIVPEQYTGKEIIAEACLQLEDQKKARHFFELVKGRLLNVNNWNKIAGFLSATFQAIDPRGNEAERKIAKGDFMRIDIPGPGSSEGDGYDWVQIEELKSIEQPEIESIGFRVRPSANPNGHPNQIAHFYNKVSTSSFIISREGTKITASIIDRNIKPNEDNSTTIDKLRNVPVAKSAINMFSKAQWQNLANGLVSEKIDE